jgi:hypothetical protein
MTLVGFLHFIGVGDHEQLMTLEVYYRFPEPTVPKEFAKPER